MAPVACCQYRSEAARDECFAWIDAQAKREWPVSSESRTVPTSFGPTFVRISGPPGGFPLVLLPGVATSSLMWAPNVEAFSAAFRTYAVDRIGDFGKSLCTRPPRSFNDLISWITEFLDALDLRRGVHLLGISYGGALAAEYALQCPSRVRRLVLIAPGATVLAVSPGLMFRLTVAAFARKRGLASLLRWLLEDAARKDPRWIGATLDQYRLHMRSTLRMVPVPRVWSDADWGRLSVPTLFLVGEHEKIYSPTKAIERLERVAPAVRGERIAGAGHDLIFVAAAAVNRSILDFLNDSAPNS
jgi:pimeloyl-ACP methyl ester carboxylesterase